MMELLRKLKIENAFWQLSRNKNFFQITFTIDDYRHEILLNILNEWGIGERKGSTVSMVPCPLYNKPNDDDEPEDADKDLEYVITNKCSCMLCYIISLFITSLYFLLFCCCCCSCVQCDIGPETNRLEPVHEFGAGSFECCTNCACGETRCNDYVRLHHVAYHCRIVGCFWIG